MYKYVNYYVPAVLIAFGALLIYGTPVFKHLYRNYALTEQAPLTSSEWKVHEVNDEKYTLSVDYAFTVEDRDYRGSEEWLEDTFKNPYAAEAVAKRNHTEITKVWYEPGNPDNSSVEKYFPMKRAIYFFILLFLLNYFLAMVSRYVNRELAEIRNKGKANGKPHD